MEEKKPTRKPFAVEEAPEKKEDKTVKLKNEPAPEEPKKSEASSMFDSIIKAKEQDSTAKYDAATASGGLGTLGNLLTATQLKDELNKGKELDEDESEYLR